MAQAIKTLNTNDFIPDTDTGKYKLEITRTSLGFGSSNYRMAKFFRETETGGYATALMPYDIDDNGTFTAYSDEPMNARAVFITD